MTKKHSKATWQCDSTWWPTLELWSHFFNIEQGAKKTDNYVAKVRDCLIHVHLDINNLAHFPNVHQIPIVLQCLIISWEEAIIVRSEATRIQLKTFIKTLTDNHWENNPAQKWNFSCCSAAILFPVRQIHEEIFIDNIDDTKYSAAIPLPARQKTCGKSHICPCKRLLFTSIATAW